MDANCRPKKSLCNSRFRQVPNSSTQEIQVKSTVTYIYPIPCLAMEYYMYVFVGSGLKIAFNKVMLAINYCDNR